MGTILKRAAWPALVGLLFGAIELARLRTGSYAVSGRQLVEILGVHAVLGLAFGLPVVLVVALATKLWPTGNDRYGGSSWRRLLHRLAPVAPAFATLYAMGGITINVLYLPARLSAPSLAADATMAAVVAVTAIAWAGRSRARLPDHLVLWLALLVIGTVAVWASVPPQMARPPAAKGVGSGDRPPDIFLILLDTLRPDRLASYGGTRVSSPRIDDLASRGLVFERAFSTTNWTRPAVASLFTSTMPSRHGATEINRRISPSLPLLADSLSARRMAVGFFTSGVNVEPSDGYDRGVDIFHTETSRPLTSITLFMQHIVLPLFPGTMRWLEGNHGPEDRIRPDRLTERALDWVRQVDRRRPVFVYLHYHGPHSPYDPPPPFAGTFSGRAPVERLTEPPDDWAGATALSADDRRQLIAQYDEEILWHDDQVGRLFDELQALGRLDHAVFIVVSDHGEAFGEHGVWAHNYGMFNEVVRIPMIVWSSFDWGQPRRLQVNASLLDLAPTLIELAGAPVPTSFDGGSLLPWLEGRRDGQRTVFIENPSNDELGVHTPDWIYFEGETGTGKERWLYDPDDPEQTDNLADRFPEVVERLHLLVTERRAMDRSRAAEATTIEIDPERAEQLRALGYLQ
jgi:arylsulfatase A-like enzyme